MYARKRIYNRLKKIGQNQERALSPFDFYSEAMSGTNLAGMIDHFHSLVRSIIEEGTAIPISEQQMVLRKKLGLPEIRFDSEEIKILTRECNKSTKE